MATFHPFGGSTYTLNASISSTATTITLTSFTEPVSGTPYTMALLNTSIAYATIAPRTSSSEFISFTGITQNADGTATLTGVTRGLAKKSPFTSSSTFQLPHSGQTQFIISDAPQLFEQYPAKANAETVAGDWTFSGNVTFNNFPVTPSNSNASSTVKGVAKLSIDPVSSTNPIAVGDNDSRVPVAYATDASGTDDYVITPSPAITAYAAGQIFTFKAGTANTNASTLNVSGLGAKTIKKNVSTDLITGDILVGQIVRVVYDGTNMQVISFLAGVINTTLQTTAITAATNTKVGTATKNLADSSGAVQTIAHGLGRTPNLVELTAYNAPGTSRTWVVSGAYDGTHNVCNWSTQFSNAAGGNSAGISTTYAIGLSDQTGSSAPVDPNLNGQYGTVTVDATNITITWIKTNTPTGTQNFFWKVS